MTNKQEEQTAANPKSFKLFGSNVSRKAYLSLAATEDVHFHFGQSSEDTALLRLFNKQTGGFYVDVGAFHPYKYSNTYLLHRFFGWNGINIDASEETINTFEAERPADLNLHTAVGGMASEAVYWKFNYPARNTISEANVRRQLEKGDAEIIGEEQVHVRTLADIFFQHLPKGRTIDLLNVDVEGVDLDVLQSNNWEQYRPRAVLVEDYTILTDGVEQSAIYQYMTEIGYTFSTHTFDTSLYLEKDFFAAQRERDTETKPETSINWLEDPVVYERALHLAEAHPEHKRLADLAAKSDKQLQLKKERIKQLEQALKTERTRNEKSYQQELKLRAQIDQLQEELKSETAAHKQLLLEFAELKQQLGRLLEKENQHNEQIQQLTTENEELTANLSNAETTVQALRHELQNEQSRYERALAQKRDQQMEFVQVQEHWKSEWDEEALHITEELVDVHEALKQEHAKNQKHLEEKYLLQQELLAVYQELRGVFTTHQQKVDSKEEQLNEAAAALEEQQKRNRKLEAKIRQKRAEKKQLDQTYQEKFKQRSQAEKQYKKLVYSRSWRLTKPVRKAADIWKQKKASASKE